MNGWQRLFTVLAVFVGVATVWAGLLNMPKKSGEFYAYSCQEPTRVTQDQARVVLKTANWREYDYADTPRCMFELTKIAEGSRYEEENGRWRKDVQVYAQVYLVFFVVLYLSGWGLGWVWRGFFPKKK